MELTGEQRIPAPRQKVWEALNDPDILGQAIPGCQSIEKHGDDKFSAKVKAKVGPVSATFGGEVTLSELNPPESYTISGEGKGGAAGFAKGGARVRLEEDGPDATILHYTVTANVGGKLAQIGSRLIDSTAKKLSGEFFEKFSEVVAGPAPIEAPAVATTETAAPAAPMPEAAPATAAPAPHHAPAAAEAPAPVPSYEHGVPPMILVSLAAAIIALVAFFAG
ncbi:CoxG family protein [Oceanibaculum nanhaiense]|uniref:CoxG family protein n=1 Tax=Oceanibaculum nanhaiense TaxID=1909734 RepID=UPI0025A403C2|nr:carbon monoxide dehydrogenase subunit G [Oceanibaculum nanhaiense]MDM7946403.1 carbon monoxide dehydrogenase subunit G [Oceanibaculum nanhaiense]